MKFNVVIGNPPYNDDTTRGNGGNGGGNSIYPLFMELADSISCRYTCLVVPANWMGQYPIGVNKRVIDNQRKGSMLFRVLHDYLNSQDIFPGIKIPTGVCYYLKDKHMKDTDMQLHIVHTNNRDTKSNRIYNSKENIIFRDLVISDVLSKIRQIDGEDYIKFTGEYFTGKRYFDIPTNYKAYKYEKTDDFNIKLYVNPMTHRTPDGKAIEFGWIPEYVVKNHKESIDKYKVLISADFSNACSPDPISIPRIIGPGEVSTETYLPILGKGGTLEEAQAIEKYLRTKFVRYLVYCMKYSHNVTSVTFRLVPAQDFTNNKLWDMNIVDIDNWLYSKYKLSTSEIDYIEGVVTRV